MHKKKKLPAVHYSSNHHEWETPQELFDALDEIHGFTLDVCATPENSKCDKYFTKEEDGLEQEWEGVCWMNPPYGRAITKWVEKAAASGCKVVCLLPARTDTSWFHDYCTKGDIDFIRGRLKFSGAKNSAPFPSMIVTFG